MNSLLEAARSIGESKEESTKENITFEHVHKLLRNDPSHDIACKVYYDSKLYDELIEIDDTVLRAITMERMEKLRPMDKLKTTATAQWTLFFSDIYIRCTMVKYNDYLDVVFSVPNLGVVSLGDIKE